MEDNIVRIDGITENSSEWFYEKGFGSIRDIAHAEEEELIEVKYVGEGNVSDLKESAQEILEKMDDNTLIYNPATKEYVEEEPENYICSCGSPFNSRAVFLAHSELCPKYSV